MSLSWDPRASSRFKTTRLTFGLAVCVILVAAGRAGPGSAEEALGKTPAPETGLRGEYFANNSLRLPVALTRFDGPIDFAYGGGGPDPSLPGDGFSIRWTGKVQAAFSETYTFFTTSDDGARLWVDGQAVVDNWAIHGPTEDSGSIDLEAGQWVDLRLEFFEEGGDAVIRLEWSSASIPREVVPADRLQYPDLAGSAIIADPPTATADGSDATTLTVMLADSSGIPLPGVPLHLMVGGRHNFLSGSSVASDAWFSIGATDPSGEATAQLASTVAETKTILVRAGDVVLDTPASFAFAAGPVTSLLVLLPGEIPDPGSAPGKAGSPESPRIGQATTVHIRTVDAYFNLADTFAGTANLGATDAGAVLPPSVDLVGGEAEVDVTWFTPGPHTLTAIDATDPALNGSAALEVLGLQIDGLRGEYFPNPDVEPPPTLSTLQETVDFDYGLGSPAPAVPPDHFSTRWGGRVRPDFSETYTFLTTSDDGVRLWVDDRLIIDHWTVHSAAEDTGALDLEAGRWYDLRLEYFDDDGPAQIRLEWSSPSTPRQVIPLSNLSFLDAEGTNLDLTPASVPADGSSVVFVSAQVLNEFGLPLADTPVAIHLSGSENLVNGVAVAPGAWTDIGVTDASGNVTADLASTLPEEKTIRLRAGGQVLQIAQPVLFESGPPVGLRLLLPGETATPGQPPGKTGTPSPIPIGTGGTLIVQAVDADFNVTTSYTGDVSLTTPDPAAVMPSRATLNEGETQVDFILGTLGMQTITATGIDDPSFSDESTVEVVPPGGLVVGSGEVLTVDDARYRMLGYLPAGAPFVFYDGRPGFLPGDDILIIAMLGNSIGTYETARVLLIDETELLLSSGLANTYDGLTDRVMVQKIPRFGDVVIQDGGVITAHAWDGSAGGVVAFRALSLSVASGGRIDASGLGFRAGEGPGSGGFGAGGGFGGTGGDHGSNAGGAGYGSPSNPILLGSAGGNAGPGLDTGNNAGLTGGGAVFLEVSGPLQLDGSILAGGTSRSLFSSAPASGAGAGGSVSIHAGNLTGDGHVSAVGGTSSTFDFDFSAYFGAGAGGRISYSGDAQGFVGETRAWGGYPNGSPGTTLIFDLAVGQRLLRVDNSDRSGRPALLTDPFPTLWQFDRIELLRGGDLALLDPDDSITVTSAGMAGDGTGQLHLPASLAFTAPEVRGFGFFIPSGTTLAVPDDFAVAGVELDVYGTLEGAGNLALVADGSQNSRVRLSALGRQGGQPPGSYQFANLQVGANQILEFAGDPAAGTGVSLNAATIVVEPGGRLSGDGLGYQPLGNRGPGAGGSSAGHGGYGGGLAGGAPYGSALEPTDLGSASAGSRAGAGGSGLHLAVDSLTLDGILSANGSNSGGAGGSLWLDVDVMSGTGMIQANGGARDIFVSTAGSGAGGRIALYTTTDTFAGTIEAAAGVDTSPSGRQYGGPGTVYHLDLSMGSRSLRVDNLGRDGRSAGISDPGPTSWAFDQIMLFGYGDLELIDADDTVLLTTGNIVGDRTALLQFHGSLNLSAIELAAFGLQVHPGAVLTLPGAFTLSGVPLTNLGTIEGLSNLTVRGGSLVNRGVLSPLTSLTLVAGPPNSLVRLGAVGNSAGQPAGTYEVGALLVNAAQIVQLAGDAASGTGVTLLSNEVTVQGTGLVLANGLGYLPSVDRGPGYGGPMAGAGHGGFGGGVDGGSPYGSALQPEDLGSAGGEDPGSVTRLGAAGGGAIHIVADSVRIDGTLSANGSTAGLNEGGGSGGSIWIEASSLSGVGTISANGGLATIGSGAGGRIAVHAANGFTGQLQAAGGSAVAGGAGTIYLQDAVTGERRLIVDNLGRIGPPAALTDPAPTEWMFDSIEINRSGRLQLLDPDDGIVLTNDNMQGDGSGQFAVVNELDLTLTTLRGFGILVRPGGVLTLPPALGVEAVPLTNEGTLLGLTDLGLSAGRFTNLGVMPHLTSLVLESMSGFHSTARLSAAGSSVGQPQATYLIDSVQINSAQTLELAADASSLPVTLQVVDITVAGHLSADGLGYGLLVGDAGPGVPLGAYGGAGHGGYGGGSGAAPNAGGLAYGSVTEPTALGSAAAGAGGGAIRLIASRSIFVAASGVVSADGAAAGGAGGSIWITTDSLQGTGAIHANGGNGNPNTSCIPGFCFYRFTGAGGRIAVYAANNPFAGSIEARGGALAPALPLLTPVGGAGTIYLRNTLTDSDQLIVDNGGISGRRAVITDPPATHWTFDRVELRGRGDLELLDAEDSMELGFAIMRGDGSAQLFSHGSLSYSAAEMHGFGLHVLPDGTLTLPSSLTLRQVAVTNESVISGLSSLSLRGGQFVNRGAMPDLNSLTLRADGSANSMARIEALGSSGGRAAGTYSVTIVEIEANQALELASDAVAGTGLTLLAGDVTVAGHLSADGLGYQPGASLGPGAPTGPNSGAGHGGQGGGLNGGPTYGSSDEPVTLGSASGAAAGGGAVRIQLEGLLDVPAGGRISANGVDSGFSFFSSGGGSGGSLWVNGPSIQGQGTIEANGGAGIGGRGGGGGGRVKLEAGFVSVDLVIRALGGPGTAPGEVGSAGVESIDFPADVAVTKSALPEAIPGSTFEYGFVVRNDGLTTAQAVTLVDILPSDATYVSDNAPATVSQAGSELTWAFGDLAPGQRLAFSMVVDVSGTGVVGEDLINRVTVSTTTNEIDLSDNASQTTTILSTGYAFEAELAPTTRTINLGASGSYLVLLRNTGILADRYTVSVSGLPAAWWMLSDGQVALGPGATGEAELIVQTSDCAAAGPHAFQITVTPDGSAPPQTFDAQLTLNASLAFSDLRPLPNATVGSRDVLFAWRTDVLASSMLSLHPVGRPAEEQVFGTAEGLAHSVLVTGLERNTAYEWEVEATSACGAGRTAVQRFTVGNGIVFTNAAPSITIIRDYDQRASFQIRNDDSLPHPVQVEIQNTYPDLIVNFVGSGSIDEAITLLPGERRTVTLAVHAPDATQREYDLTAVLTADEGTVPITDTARIHVTVLSESDFTLDELGADPISGIRTYRVHNFGLPVTDLSVRAVDPTSGLPAQVLITPEISHARLATGESLTFQVFPLFGPGDVSESQGLTAGPGLAAPASIGEAYEIEASAAGAFQRLSATRGCPEGSQLYPVSRGRSMFRFPKTAWHCTNRPIIEAMFGLPAFIQDAVGGMLEATFSPRTGEVLPHSVQLALNGVPIAALSDTIPNGSYAWNVPGSTFRDGALAGTNAQELLLTSQHPNGGHYSVASDFALSVAVDEVTVWICATSQEEAERIFDEMYDPIPLPASADLEIVFPQGDTATPEADGRIRIMAHVFQDTPIRISYPVIATIEYLDAGAGLTEAFPLFDTGEPVHGDLYPGDGFYNERWIPQASGRVLLTVVASIPGLGEVSDSKTFTVQALSDLAVLRVWQNEVSIFEQQAHVYAEITNLGAAVVGPIPIEYRYYNADPLTGQPIGLPIHVTRMVILDGQTLARGQVVTVVDDQFQSAILGLYHVVVVVDPP